MNLVDTLKQLRDDIKTWVTNNIRAVNSRIDETAVYVDSELNTNSTNPVQNKVITNALNNIPKFSGNYNDLDNAPDIEEDASGNMIIADENGNVIATVDAGGIATTSLTLNGQPAATEQYVNEAFATVSLDNHYTKDETDATIEAAKKELSEEIQSDSEDWKLLDKAGNIIFQVDAEGAHTTALTLNGMSIQDMIKSYVEETLLGGSW